MDIIPTSHRDLFDLPAVWHVATIGPDGEPVSIVGLDSSIIQNPRAWEASGHVGGFNDPMVDCRETKSRDRADHLLCLGADQSRRHADWSARLACPLANPTEAAVLADDKQRVAFDFADRKSG